MPLYASNIQAGLEGTVRGGGAMAVPVVNNILSYPGKRM